MSHFGSRLFLSDYDIRLLVEMQTLYSRSFSDNFLSASGRVELERFLNNLPRRNNLSKL